MTEVPENRKGSNDELNRLIRDSRESTTGTERPAFSTIDVYVYGVPTQAQKREIRAAMLASESFRREIVVLCEEAAKLQSNETRRLFDDAEFDEMPADLAKEAAAPESTKQLRNGLHSNWILSLAAAAILIIAGVFLLNQSDNSVVTTEQSANDSISNRISLGEKQTPTVNAARTSQQVILRLHTAGVEKALLVRSSNLRGTGSKPAYDSQMSAALGSFAQSLRLDDNGVFRETISSNVDSLLQLFESITINITISLPEGNYAEIHFDIPKSAKNMTLWALTLPQLSLYTSDLPGSREFSVPMPLNESNSNLFTITYTYGNQNQATSAQNAQK